MEVVSSNVNQVQIPQTQAPPRPFGAAQEIPAEFLTLRQLNKHAHLRVSPYPLDSKAFQGPVSLFAASASKACFATVIRTADPASGQQFAIALGSLANLRQALSQGTAQDNLIPFTPQKTFDCGAEKPVILKFAANDERLVVGFEQGPVLVFDVNAFVNSNDRPTPMVFQSDASGYPRSIHPNPGDHPELVAVLRGIYGQDRGLYVEVLDVMNHKIVGGWFSSTSIDAMPVSVSWSPRGKQIAIGTHSGDILLYSPQDTSMLALKGHVPRPSDPALAGCCAFSITWLANPTFHVIYANPRAVAKWDVENEDHPEYHHRIVVHDKATPGELALSDNPCSPFGAKRLPGPTNVVLKNWGKIKFLIFAGDGPSSDVGAIGCIDDKWGLLALDETSRAALPLTADMDESALFGLELDLTSPEAIKGEQPDDDSLLPPAPILCAYTSEGWLVAWHVIAQREGQYPGLTTAPGSSQMSTKPLTPPTTLNTQPPAPAFGSPAQQASPFGAAAAKTPSPFGTPQPAGSFGSPSAAPTFGSTGFGSTPAAPTFGSTGFGSAPTPAAPASGSAFGGGGFSAFANKTSAFGTPASSSTPSPFAAAAASAKAGETKPVSAFAPSPTAAPTFGSTSTPAAPAFGSTSTPAGPTFGQSSFGFAKPAAPAFGQTGFGFGQPGAAAAAPAAPAAGGGFGAFANKPSAFGSGATSPSTAEPAKATPAAPAGSGPFSAFAGQPSAFGAAATDAAKPAQVSGGFGAFANKTASFGSGSSATDAAAGPFSAFANKTSAFSAPTPPAEPAKPAAEAPKPVTQSSPAFGQSAFTQPKAPAPASTKPPALRSESPPSSDDERPKPSSSSVSLASFVKPSAAFGAFNKAQDSAANKDAKPSPFALAASGGNVLGQATVATAGFGQPSALGSLGLGNAPGAGATFGTAFGQTSALGIGKPSAAAQDKSKETVSTPIAGGGFSAFSNTGGFSAFAGGRTASFGGAAKDSSAQDEAARKVFGDAKPSTSSEGSGKDSSTKDEAAKVFRDTQPATSPGDTAKDAPAEEATVTDNTKPATLFGGKKNLRKAATAEEDVGPDLGALKLSLDDKDASTTPDASPAKPANPHGSAFSTPAKSAFPAPAQSTTPAETPSKESSAPASSPFGSFAKSSSPFGSFSTKDGTTIANAFAPQTPATTTPKKDDAATSTTPSTTPAEPIFGKSSFFGTNPLFGQTPASSPAPVSAFAAFAGKPSVFGPPPTKDDAADKDASSSTPTKSPSLLDRMGPPVPSLLSRMGPPPPVRIEPLPPDSDEGEEEEGDEDDEDDEGELQEGEDGEEDFDSEGEYELEEGEEEEDEEGDEDDEEDPADSPTKGKDKAKAKSEDPPATSSIFKVPEITTTKPEPVRAVSEPASPFSKQVQPAESTPAKPSLFGLGRPGLGGAPARSSPLASNPPVTASENDGRAAPAPPKPTFVLPGPAVTPFPGFTDSAKKPMPTFSGFPAAPPPATPTPATPLGAGKFSPAPFPGKPSPVPALFGENRSATPAAFPSSPAQSPLAAPQTPQAVRPTSQADPSATHPVAGETPLQQQFAEIYIQMTRDLEHLGVDARRLAQQQAELSQPRGGRTPADLRTPEKWGPGDLVAFQQVIRNFEKEAMGLKDHSLEIAKMFADLQSLLLQAEVKKEEMVRYARANKDPEFKRMINVRGLGPEQEESQTKLRKQIQAVGDRVQQLEDVIDNLQRKLEAHNSGRYRIEAPTLDTINRTCRNIDIALEQRASEISRLANRVAQLRLSNSAPPANPASTSNAEKKHARAASIAHAKAADAALCAEHSAERLKNILSRARTEPILSVVSSAPPVKHISQRSQPVSAPTPAKTPPMPTAGGSPGGFFNFAPGATLPKTPPKFEWTPPQAQAESPAESDDGSPLGDRRGGSRRQARHSGSVKFEKKESTSSSQVVPFDWGPLPEFAAGKK